MNGQGRIDERRRRQAGRRGFTLIELSDGPKDLRQCVFICISPVVGM